MSAHAAAVETMAEALCGAPNGGQCSSHRQDATKALAAFASSEEVQAALEHTECLLHPGQDKCGGAIRGANVRFHLPCIFAALAAPEPS